MANITTRTERDWVNRPGCVTLYAMLLWLAPAGVAAYGLYVVILGQNFPDPVAALTFLLAAIFMLPFMLLSVLAGIGLWRMKAWGWWLVMVFGLLQLGLNVLSFLGELAAGDWVSTGSQLLGFAIAGYILWWFFTHRAMFNVGSGKPLPPPSASPPAQPLAGKG
jgi:hypothetical protein